MNRHLRLGFPPIEFFMALIIVTVVAIPMSCHKTLTTREKERWRKYDQHVTAYNVIDKLIYMKDPRTNQCFAYYPNGRSITAIPCDTIPAELLMTVPTVNVTKSNEK